ncbi:lysozyme [Leisingera sp. ANG59]|uniref:lysozyme n=1 Tax=Leisingera sp. ANG59 TaxID=2675221 RepID=UPI0015719DC3|nr:lysozyme [Leisingera sp. ANG59]NSY36861.1 glycoside hydrolase family protein [Leisingera sp. ANG59]
MKLIDNWRQVFRGAWSIHLVLIATVISALAAFLGTTSAEELGMNPVYFAAAAAVINALAIPARLIMQNGLSALQQYRRDESGAVRRRGLVGLGGGALVIALATPFIAQWEGVRLQAYRDIVGVPTICFGDTHSVQMGDRSTMADCVQRLEDDVQAFYSEIAPCMTNPGIPPGVQASMLELAFNVGSPSVCRSTMMRLANAGQYQAACDELRRWVIAGGRRIRGLENRRADSKRSLCMRGLT